MVFYHLYLAILGWVSLGLLARTVKHMDPVKAGKLRGISLVECTLHFSSPPYFLSYDSAKAGATAT